MSQTTLLLDTNILLCALIAPNRLNKKTQELLRNQNNSVIFSAASIWEVAIKSSLGRNDFDFSPEDIRQLALDTGFFELAVESTHTFAVSKMPWHHRDPFDRLLVAQSMSLPAYLLTGDVILRQYTELVLVVEIS